MLSRKNTTLKILGLQQWAVPVQVRPGALTHPNVYFIEPPNPYQIRRSGDSITLKVQPFDVVKTWPSLPRNPAKAF